MQPFKKHDSLLVIFGLILLGLVLVFINTKNQKHPKKTPILLHQQKASISK